MPSAKVGAGGTAIAGATKPVAQPLALWSTRHGSRRQAASWRAVFRWPAQWRSGGGAGGQAVAGGTEPWRRFIARRRWSSTRGGSDGAGLAGLFASAVTERSGGSEGIEHLPKIPSVARAPVWGNVWGNF